MAGERGYNPARRVAERRRHVLIVTAGHLPAAVISPANRHDSHDGVMLLRGSRRP